MKTQIFYHLDTKMQGLGASAKLCEINVQLRFLTTMQQLKAKNHGQPIMGMFKQSEKYGYKLIILTDQHISLKSNAEQVHCAHTM